MSKWLKEPLFHFLLLGALIFLVYGMTAEKGRSQGEIFITQGQQESLVNTFSRTWQRPPTAEEFMGLLDDYVRQEIAYRESQNMGLDDNDIIVRRRMRQKLELLAEDVASLAVPSDEQLQAFMETNAADYRLDPVLSLKQIYFSPDRRGESTTADAQAVLAELQTPGADVNPEQAGDPLPLPYAMEGLRESEISRRFGAVFVEGLKGVNVGAWSGPIASGFGQHLVYVDDRIEGRIPSLDEARAAVQRDWFNKKRREAVDGLYARLAENYSIEVESFNPTDAGEQP
jgi:hypothetical protein